MKSLRIALVLAVGVIAALSLRDFPSHGEDRVTKIPVVTDAKKNESVRPYMHAKMLHSEQVFEGLVTHDFDKIRKAAEELQLTTLSTPGVAAGETRDDEVFEHFKVEFLRLSARLEQVAVAENLEGAAYIHQQLNATCIDCHQYLKDPRTGDGKASGKASKK